jgi:2-polyprenyl-3-methyl-5-hydroxy-6-metoxy-1,4-benzoquinol methylase
MEKSKLPPSAYGPEEMARHYHNFDVEQGRYRFIDLEIPEGAKVLEVGCFLGHYCNYFSQRGLEVTGVDISPEVIAEAQKIYPQLDLRCVGDTWPQDLQDGRYDVVIASEVIEHVLHPSDFLKCIHRALKPEGRLLLTTQNSNAIHYRLRMLFGKFRWDPTHLRLYSRPELEAELQGGGFEVLKAVGIPINPKGPQRAPRLLAYWAARLHANFCWTWGMVAKPVKI